MSPATVSFAPEDFECKQESCWDAAVNALQVVVSGVRDHTVDGDATVTVTASLVSSADARYNATSAYADIQVTVKDVDQAAILVQESGDDTVVVEGQGTDTVLVSLHSLPAGDVEVTLVPLDAMPPVECVKDFVSRISTCRRFWSGLGLCRESVLACADGRGARRNMP